MHLNRLYLKTIPVGTPAYFFSEDLELDIELNEEFKLTESLQDITEFNELGDSAVFGFRVVDNAKHNWIFEKYRHFSVLNGAVIPVCAFAGSHLLNHDTLMMKLVSQGGYECELIIGEKHWLNKELYLNELDYGEFYMEYQNIVDSFPNDVYVEDTTRVYLPRIYYNKWHESIDNMLVEDFRPLPFLSFMMFEGFKRLGWQLVSDFLNSAVGRGIICYVLKKDYYNHSRAGLGSELTMINPSLTDSTNTDYILTYSSTTGNASFYTAPDTYENIREIPVTLDVNFSCQFRRFTAGTFSPTFRIEKYSSLNGVFLWRTAYNYTITYDNSPNYHDVSFSKSITLESGDKLRLRVVNGQTGMFFDNLAVAVKFSTELNTIGTEKTPYLLNGDTVTISEIIGKYDFRDLVKGLAHFGFIFHTDFNNRTVTMMPLDKQVVRGVTYNGFFTGNEINLTDWYVNGSTKMPFATRENKFIRYAFKSSTDGYVGTEELDTEEHRLFSNTFDFLEGENTEIETSENPFFEPTPNISTEDGYRIPVIGGENNDLGNNFALDIPPRIFYCNHDSQVTFPQDGSPFTYHGPWVFEKVTQGILGIHPNAWQVQDFQMFENISTPPRHLTYANNFSVIGDAIRAYVNHLLVMPTIEVIVRINWLQFNQMNFRDYIFLHLDSGKPVSAILREKRDFYTESEIPTVLSITPRNNGELYFLQGSDDNPIVIHNEF